MKSKPPKRGAGRMAQLGKTAVTSWFSDFEIEMLDRVAQGFCASRAAVVRAALIYLYAQFRTQPVSEWPNSQREFRAVVNRTMRSG